jgi:putative PEP-CTERM system TPR-repeat lipoprotein
MMLAFSLGAACGAQTPDELFARAQEAIASGDVATANIHLRNLLQDSPDHVPARALLARTALALGDVALAEQAALRAIESGTDSSIHLVLLQALEAQGRFVDIADHFDRMPELAEEADRAMALAIVGSAWQSMGVLDEAEQSLRDALALLPDSPQIATRLASVFLVAGKGDEARQQIANALRRDSEYTPALSLRAMLELQANQIAAAEATLNQALQIEQDNPTGQQYVMAAARLVDVQLTQEKVEAASATADTLFRANPSNPFARFAKASTEFASGDIESAEPRLQALIADAPQFWEAYRLLGQIDAQQGQWGQAQQNLSAAVTNNPDDAVARLHLAGVFVQQGDLARARQLFPAPEMEQVSDDLFLALIGGVSLRAGQSELAASYFDNSALFAADGAVELRSLVAVLLASGQTERALTAIENAELASDDDGLLADYLTASIQIAAGNLDTAAEVVNRLVQDHPELSWTHSLLGSLAVARQDLDEARLNFVEAATIEPENVSTLMALANLEARAGNLAAAEGYLQRIANAEPGQVNAVFGLARIALSRNDTEAARSWLRQAPDSLQRTELLGRVDVVEGNFDSAADAFASVFDSQPSFESARLYYVASSSAGRPNPEEKLLSWLQINPLDVPANAMLGSIELGNKQYEDAIERFERMLGIEPDNAAVLNNLAWLYDQRGDARALDFAERAYANAPEAQRSAIADTLGWMLLARGETDRALELLEDAAAGDPNTPDIQYHLASALIQNGQTERGAGILGAVLANDVQFDGRADAEELLRTVRNSN